MGNDVEHLYDVGVAGIHSGGRTYLRRAIRDDEDLVAEASERSHDAVLVGHNNGRSALHDPSVRPSDQVFERKGPRLAEVVIVLRVVDEGDGPEQRSRRHGQTRVQLENVRHVSLQPQSVEKRPKHP